MSSIRYTLSNKFEVLKKKWYTKVVCSLKKKPKLFNCGSGLLSLLFLEQMHTHTNWPAKIFHLFSDTNLELVYYELLRCCLTSAEQKGLSCYNKVRRGDRVVQSVRHQIMKSAGSNPTQGIVLCSKNRLLLFPLSNQVYKWVPYPDQD